MKRQRGASKPIQIDPLYIIFEQHLYNFQDASEDRRTFLDRVIQDYFRFLRRRKISVPVQLESSIMEELRRDLNVILTKKIYGCLTLGDYQKSVPSPAKHRARTRYRKLCASG